MKTVECTYEMRRREFLRLSGGAALGAGVVASGLAPVCAFAASDTEAHFNATVLRLGRDIYPHDTLADPYYWDPLKTLISDKRSLLEEGIAQLDDVAMKRQRRLYRHVVTETDRVVILQTQQFEPYFQAVRTALLFGIYNNQKLWEPFFGYEGPSWRKGGYINRGFNDLGWL